MPGDLDLKEILCQALAEDMWTDGEIPEVIRYLADNRHCCAPAEWSEGV